MNRNHGIRRLFFIGVVTSLITGSSSFSQGLEDAFRISASGIVAQKFRLRLIAENMANLVTFKTETGLPYAKKIAVMESTPYGVRVARVDRSTTPFPKYFDPDLPQADAGGFFYLPNVNLPDEYIDLAFTENMYEANIAAFKTTKTMYQQALEMLK